MTLGCPAWSACGLLRLSGLGRGGDLLIRRVNTMYIAEATQTLALPVYFVRHGQENYFAKMGELCHNDGLGNKRHGEV